MKKVYNVPSTYQYQNQYQYHYYDTAPMHNYERQSVYRNIPNGTNQYSFKDYGPEPFVVNINEATKRNKTYRTALWTGNRLQVALMSLNVGEDIGLEMHPDVDQFLRIELGQGIVQMGKSKDNFDFERNVNDDFAK